MQATRQWRWRRQIVLELRQRELAENRALYHYHSKTKMYGEWFVWTWYDVVVPNYRNVLPMRNITILEELDSILDCNISMYNFGCLRERNVERALVAPSTWPTQGGLECLHLKALHSIFCWSICQPFLQISSKTRSYNSPTIKSSWFWLELRDHQGHDSSGPAGLRHRPVGLVEEVPSSAWDHQMTLHTNQSPLLCWC